MADPTFFELFKITWAQNGLTEGITDVQYKTGWAYIGSIPPSVEQFNKVQQATDERLGWLYNQLDALAAVTGRPLVATSSDALSYAFQNLNASNLKSGTVPVARLSGTATSLTAGAAQKLATARTISLSGDATGSGSFDGSANLSFSLTLANTAVGAGSFGNANTIPTFTVDAKGRLTAAGSVPVGNAATATKLATGRTFTIAGGATAAAANFDGTGNVVLTVTALDVSKATAGTLGVVRGGTGLATVPAGSFLCGAGTGPLVPRTPAQVLEDIQALPKAGGNVSGPILLGAGATVGSQYGANDTSAQVAHAILPDGGGYSVNLASVVGAIKIKLPPVAVGKNSMIRMRVEVFEYLADQAPITVLIHGYAQTSKTWARCGATIVGGTSASDLPVRFGSDAAGDLCVWLGDVTKNWSYPTVSVAEVLAKYNTPGAAIADWGVGWKVEPVTAFETVSVTLAADNLAFARSDIARVQGLQEALDQKAVASRQIIAGNGLTGGGQLTANRTITLGTPASITKDSTNLVSTTSHSHELVLSPADIGAASATTNIVAGNGLTGGGTLGENRTLTLGTPGSITANSTNSVSSTSHTHQLTLSPADIGAPPTSRNLVAGNGLTGGGNLAGDRTFTLGTPSTLSGATTNAVSSTSHTHELAIASESLAGIVKLASEAQAQAMVDNSTFLSPLRLVNAFAKGIGSSASISWIILPGIAPSRMMFMFGTSVTNASSVAPISFPISFAAPPIVCGALHSGSGPANITLTTLPTLNSAQFTVWVAGGGGVGAGSNVNWIAIGRV